MRREPKQAGELPKHVQEKRLPTPFLVIRMGFALEVWWGLPYYNFEKPYYILDKCSIANPRPWERDAEALDAASKRWDLFLTSGGVPAMRGDGHIHPWVPIATLWSVCSGSETHKIKTAFLKTYIIYPATPENVLLNRKWLDCLGCSTQRCSGRDRAIELEFRGFSVPFPGDAGKANM